MSPWVVTAKWILGGIWEFLRSIPWQAWLFAAVVLAALWYGENRADAREAEVRDEFAARDAAADEAARVAEAERDRKAKAASSDADKAGAKATTETRVTTATAAERVRYVTRTIQVPAECADAVRLPDSVRSEGREAVSRARAAAGQVRAGANP